MGNVKVSFEPFGGGELTRTFDGSEIKNKNIKDVLELMLSESWPGKDITVADGIKKEMSSSGGYEIAQKLGGIDTPVRYEPIPLTGPIREYEVDNKNSELPEVKFGVVGIHEVGYNL